MNWQSQSADLEKTILRQVKFPADISGWNFLGANLTGVDFSGIEGCSVCLQSSIMDEAVLGPAACTWDLKGATLATVS